MNTTAPALIYTVRQQKGRFYLDSHGQWCIRWPKNASEGLKELVAEYHMDIIVQLDMERAWTKN